MSTTLSLAGVAAAAALKVVIAGAAGGLTARRLRLDARVLTALSEVNKELFIPLMIFTSCAEGITASMLTHLKGVPVMSLAFMLNGLVCGQLAARLTAAPRAARPITTALCGFSNVVGLPLPLLLSITAAVPALAGPADPSLPEAHAQSLESRTLSYLFLVNVVMSVCMWVCAPRMLAAAAAIAETDARPSVAGGGGYTPGLPYRRCVSARSSAADSSPMLAAGAAVGPVAIEMQPSGDCAAAAAACAAAGAAEGRPAGRRAVRSRQRGAVGSWGSWESSAKWSWESWESSAKRRQAGEDGVPCSSTAASRSLYAPPGLLRCTVADPPGAGFAGGGGDGRHAAAQAGGDYGCTAAVPRPRS